MPPPSTPAPHGFQWQESTQHDPPDTPPSMERRTPATKRRGEWRKENTFRRPCHLHGARAWPLPNARSAGYAISRQNRCGVSGRFESFSLDRDFNERLDKRKTSEPNTVGARQTIIEIPSALPKIRWARESRSWKPFHSWANLVESGVHRKGLYDLSHTCPLSPVQP
jgi:hypothetical protein